MGPSRNLLKEQGSYNLVQNMGHKGPVLRAMCIGHGRAQTQILFCSILEITMDWTRTKTPSQPYIHKTMQAEFTSSLPVGTTSFKLEEGVQECAARHLRCHNWQLTAQNRTVWRHKLCESKSWLWDVVPYKHCLLGVVKTCISKTLYFIACNAHNPEC